MCPPLVLLWINRVNTRFRPVTGDQLPLPTYSLFPESSILIPYVPSYHNQISDMLQQQHVFPLFHLKISNLLSNQKHVLDRFMPICFLLIIIQHLYVYVTFCSFLLQVSTSCPITFLTKVTYYFSTKIQPIFSII